MMIVYSEQLVEQHRRDLMQQAEQHRLAREAREAKHDGNEATQPVSNRQNFLQNLIPQQPKKPVRRPA